MLVKPLVSAAVTLAGGIAIHPDTATAEAAAVAVWFLTACIGMYFLLCRRTRSLRLLAVGVVIDGVVACLPIALTRDIGGPWVLYLIWPVFVASALMPMRIAWLTTGTVLATYGSVVAAWGRADQISEWLTVAVWLVAMTTTCSALHASSLALSSRLREQALLDPLTGLANRRAFDSFFDAQIAHALRHPQRITLLLFDVDHFKRVNDSAGHATGDALLSRLGSLLEASVRPGDLAARIGGEEFAVLLLGATLDDGVRRAEEIRQRVSVTSRETWGRSVTVSVGVACRPENAGQPGIDLIALADGALYEAKASGRNSVRAAA
jgi:diguanylate cyclase (GGDEF)-like protein